MELKAYCQALIEEAVLDSIGEPDYLSAGWTMAPEPIVKKDVKWIEIVHKNNLSNRVHITIVPIAEGSSGAWPDKKYHGNASISLVGFVKGERKWGSRIPFNVTGDEKDDVTAFKHLVNEMAIPMAEDSIGPELWNEPDMKKDRDFEEPRGEQKTTVSPKVELAMALKGDDEDAIIRAVNSMPHRWKSDDVLDVYNKAKELRSNKLMNLVRLLKTESLPSKIVRRLLD
jgi:hypothetical protein